MPISSTNALMNQLLSKTSAHLSGDENGVAIFKSESTNLRRLVEAAGFVRRVDSSRAESWGFNQYWDVTESLFLDLSYRDGRTFTLTHGAIGDYRPVMAEDFANV